MALVGHRWADLLEAHEGLRGCGPWGVVVVGTKDGWLACFFVLGQTFCNKVKSSVKFLCCFLFKVIQR